MLPFCFTADDDTNWGKYISCGIAAGAFAPIMGIRFRVWMLCRLQAYYADIKIRNQQAQIDSAFPELKSKYRNFYML
jgi:hypothetical protein